MAQGGFGRDYVRAARLKEKALSAEKQKERKKVGEEVVVQITPHLQSELKRIEKELILAQDRTVSEFISQFITVTEDRNRLLKFLIWTNFISLLALSFTLGYFL